MKQLSRVFSLIVALTGAILAYADRIGEIPGFSGLSPSLVHAWPIVLACAFLVHQGAGIIITQIRQWQAQDAEPATVKASAPDSSTKTAAAILLITGIQMAMACALAMFVSSCASGTAPASTASASPSLLAKVESLFSSVQSDVKKGLAWAQSPEGKQILTTVEDGFNIYANTAGGAKSKATAANVSTALRSLQNGQFPNPIVLANAIETYTGSGGNTAPLVNSILATVSAAPSNVAGLEAAATKLDAISATASAQSP